MKERLVISLASMFLCGLMTPAGGNAQTRGDFSLSCSNLNLASSSKTAVLRANCRRVDGSIDSGASINLNDYITNSNGNLAYVGAGGDFSASCSNINLDPKTGVLKANCRRADGRTNSGASINLNDDITNDNGNLRYVGGGGGAPPGPTNPVLGPPNPPAGPPPGPQTAAIPQRDGGVSGVVGVGDPDPEKGGLLTGDSMPYHVRGEVEYFRVGNDVRITAVHIFGWATGDGNFPYNCGHLLINAKHLSINGTDYSGNLVFEATLQPQGWVKSAWVAKFRGPEYPTFRRGGSVSIKADGAFDGMKCILGGQVSITSSVTL